MLDGGIRSLIDSQRIALLCFPPQIDLGYGHLALSSGEEVGAVVLKDRQIGFEAVSLVGTEWVLVE